MADGRRLPEEMMTEILLRLPVKSLERFKSVSRNWFSVIKAPEFIRAHHGRQKPMLLVARHLDKPEYIVSLHNVEDRNDGVDVGPHLILSKVPLLDDLPDHYYPHVHVLGASRGFVCIKLPVPGRWDQYVLVNPGLMAFKVVPPHPFDPPEGYSFTGALVGFGFDPDTNDFKIVLLEDVVMEDELYHVIDRIYYACVYRCSSYSWSRIEYAKNGYVTGSSFFFNGSCHWEAMNTIFYFDICAEVAGHLELLDAFLWHRMSLTVVDECLAVVLYHYQDEANEAQHIHIWAMKEYGVKDSWTKLYVLGPHVLSRPLLFLDSDKGLLVETREGLLATFSLHDDNEIKTFPNIRGSVGTLRALLYKESLIR